MSSLTLEQRAFLRSQKISLADVFDASGMTRKEYSAAMEETGQHFASGVTPCARGGHTLRTKTGTCIQCDTVQIAFALRHNRPADVYIAGSTSQRLIKVGMTNDREKRRLHLNKHLYGAASDWEMLAWANTKGAGRVEFQVHEALRDHQVPALYEVNGKQQRCYELFRCTYSLARDALRDALPPDATIRAQSEGRLLAVYS